MNEQVIGKRSTTLDEGAIIHVSERQEEGIDEGTSDGQMVAYMKKQVRDTNQVLVGVLLEDNVYIYPC